MPSQSPDSTLRKRSGSLKTSRTPLDLISDHPAIKPIAPSPSDPSNLSASGSKATAIAPPSVASRILHILLKPVYFILFALLHIGHEIAISFFTMKTYIKVFFMPHKYPSSPLLVRVLRDDLSIGLAKKPKHLAVILPAASLSEEEEETWHSRVSELAQWSVTAGIKCLSVMRTDALIPEFLELLQERIDFEMKEFYKEETTVPEVRVRALGPVHVGNNSVASSVSQQVEQKNNSSYDLDVVILSEHDGHDRIAANVRALGEAALHKEIQSQDINTEFLDRQLSAELTEPELLIVFKDELDLSSYPPWHIRLTEIYHNPDQYIIPQYTMFLQALHQYAKCEQRFGK